MVSVQKELKMLLGNMCDLPIKTSEATDLLKKAYFAHGFQG